MFKGKSKLGRRDLFKASAGIMGGTLLSREAAAEQSAPRNVNTNSSPSALKVTDLRVATVVKPGPSPCPLIRIDTNQGVYGLGEVRDGASATYALFLKSRLLNENPLNITYLFQKIKQFGFHGRQAGGVVAVEEALWDIAGKVYNVPIYQMLGGKFRERVRIYADTDESPDPKVFAQRLKARKEEMGITWLKMDVGINLVEHIPGTVTGPSELTAWERRALPHPFVATEVTEKGIEKLSEYVQAAREAVGMEIPLSMDHLGHLGVNSIIRLGKAYEKFNLSWMEDVIPWQYTEMLEHITAESPTPILHRRRHLPQRGLHQPVREARRQQDPSRISPPRAASSRRTRSARLPWSWASPWRCTMPVLPVDATGERSLRRGHGEFPGLRKSLAGCPVVAGPGGRHRKAHHQQGLHQGSRQARAGHHAE